LARAGEALADPAGTGTASPAPPVVAATERLD
jgi:hypothetical protein